MYIIIRPRLGHQGGDFTSEIIALINFPHERIQQEGGHANQDVRLHQMLHLSAPSLGLPA